MEKQHQYIREYGGHNPVEVGILCDKYPGLKNAWQQYKLLYKICKGSE